MRSPLAACRRRVGGLHGVIPPARWRRGLGLERCCGQCADPLGERHPKTTDLAEWVCTLADSLSGVACCPDRFPAAAWPVLLGRAAVCAGGRRPAREIATRELCSEWSISKPGQALPPPTGTAARPRRPRGGLLSVGACRLCVARPGPMRDSRRVRRA